MITALLLSVAVPAPPAVWNHPLPYEQYRAISDCETQSDTAHSTRRYVTAFGMTRHVWNMFADAHDSKAPRMTYAQQARVLDRVFFYGHTERGRKQWPVGPWGHACFKHLYKTTKLRTLVCHNHKQAIRRWCR
jgi:hypothetical protein